MREAISKSLSSSLEWDDSEHQRAIDKLTAFSYAEKLGTLLWRVKYFNDASSYRPAVFLLAKALPRLNKGIAIKVSQQVMNEWLYGFCQVCLGAKEVLSGEHVILCNSCGGSGVRKYTDAERAKAIGANCANMGKQIKLLHDIIGGIDVGVAVKTRLKLHGD